MGVVLSEEQEGIPFGGLAAKWCSFYFDGGSGRFYCLKKAVRLGAGEGFSGVALGGTRAGEDIIADSRVRCAR
jgi:hypothetical protein